MIWLNIVMNNIKVENVEHVPAKIVVLMNVMETASFV